MSASAGEKVVFLDRDGTLNIDRGYTTDPRDLAIYPGAGAALGKLKAAGYRTVIVTNQSAIGRGMATRADVEATNAECLSQLKAEDSRAVIDVVRYCPHAPEESCSCRKPKTGMVDELPFEFDAGQSWIVGDKCLDLELGVNLGLPPGQCILVLTGEGGRELELAHDRLGSAVQVAADIGEAAERILQG